MRVQSLEKVSEQFPGGNNAVPVPVAATDWCKDADDWDEDDDDFNANLTEENGNLINNKMSDEEEEEESCSYDDSLRQCLGNLTVDDQNANLGAHGELFFCLRQKLFCFVKFRVQTPVKFHAAKKLFSLENRTHFKNCY